MLSSFDWFARSPGEKSHAELCGRMQLLGCRKNFKELHGLNLAPIEPQVFIKNSFACEGFDGTRMALLDAGGLVTNVSFNFLSFVSHCLLGFGRIIFRCVPSFLFICFHAMIFLAGFLAGSSSDFFSFVSRCLLGWMPALPGCNS